jgi:hypothetical protein
MTSAVSRLLNLLVWIGALMILSDVWGPVVSLLLTALEWLAANPTWIPPVSLYLACVIVKTYLEAQSVPLMTKAFVRYAGLILACAIWFVLLLFLVIPFMIHQKSRFWRRDTHREIVEDARRDERLISRLKWAARWESARRSQEGSGHDYR